MNNVLKQKAIILITSLYDELNSLGFIINAYDFNKINTIHNDISLKKILRLFKLQKEIYLYIYNDKNEIGKFYLVCSDIIDSNSNKIFVRFGKRLSPYLTKTKPIIDKI